MVEKTELETTADIAAKSASNALKQALCSMSPSNIDIAVYYIGQHAIALMKLAAEREHVVMRQKQGGDFEFKGFAPNAPEYTERDVEMFARGMQMQYALSQLRSSSPSWERMSALERSEWTRRAYHSLGMRPPGEPWK